MVLQEHSTIATCVGTVTKKDMYPTIETFLCKIPQIVYAANDVFAAALQKQKDNFQPDRVIISVAASMPNNVHTSRSVTLLDQYRL